MTQPRSLAFVEPDGLPTNPQPEEEAAPTAPPEEGMVSFLIDLPSGRRAMVALPVGCAPGEALYLVSQINELAGQAYRANPAAHPGGRPKPKLWVPG